MTKRTKNKIDLNIFPAGLSRQVHISLLEEGITSVKKLTRLSRNELLQIYGVGPVLVEEINKALKEKGLSLSE